MRNAPLLVALLMLPACAVVRQAPPPLMRPGPVATPAPAGASPVAESTGSTSTPALSAAPAAAAVAPPSLPSPASSSTSTPPAPSTSHGPRAPAPVPTPASPPTAPPPPQSAPLTASLSPLETRRLQDDALRRIEGAERLLRQLEGRPFAPQGLETLRLARSLVEQARKALGGEEYERAANLAAKARTLAEDLSAQR